ncbi:sodium-coupled monocarboxylate transporter 1-like [Penaeus japonicus]|uniref:sodium-coupled monocarboxylate transporter 1-like n=1 Tax=Penaeus japonicus TaxID=27405 RepID=UPI001C710FDD|nr:sodium-coupled monocarboxylate transporter 1-like [Penaeus japonicus]
MNETDAGVMVNARFTTADYAVFVLMLVVSVAIGVHSAVRGGGSSSTQQYLLGGRRMSPVPVAISLLGGIISAISILGNATEMYYFGTQLSVNLLGCVIGTFITQWLILPLIYPLQIVSINEYIERRFKSSKLRKMATSCQLLQYFIYMGICLYAPALTLSTVTSLPTWASIITMGLICTFYITIGGVKAVVYTDVVQTLLMFFGVLVVVIICCIRLGGLGEVWGIADQGHRIEFFNMNPSPFERHTFWTSMAHGIYLIVAYVGLNQQTYQRFASVETLTISLRLCTFFLFGLWVLWVLFYFSGLVAYATYSTCDPLTAGNIEKPDQIIPYLVVDKLGHLAGLPGLFVAAVYGGVLSSLSSTANSIACVIWEDFLKHREYFKGISDRSATNVIKLLSAATGLLAIALGLLAGNLGSIFQMTQTVLGAISGPLIGIFISGICVPWANAKGAASGFVVSFLSCLTLVVGKFMRGGASPPMLPLSVAGCGDAFGNSTDIAVLGLNTTSLDYGSDVSTSFPPQDFSTIEPDVEEESKSIYDISYCYNGTIGILLTVIICSIVSLFTGPMKPDEINHLVSPYVGSLYRRFWKYREGKHYTEQDMKDEEDDVGISMVVRRT